MGKQEISRPAAFTTTLNCGMKVVLLPAPSEVVFCGCVVCAGTRHEDAADAGMAHFIEHMSFKGTHRRRAFHVNNCLERVGGDINAFTNKQETVYHATVRRQDFARAADLLLDITLNSTFPQHEIDKEVSVICDEIDSVRESPSEHIFDDFEALIFGSHPLARDILGTPERLRQYTTADARRFADRFYKADNMTFFASGDLDPKQTLRTLERLTAHLPAAAPRPLPTANCRTADVSCAVRREERIEAGRHQAHVLMGRTALPAADGRFDARKVMAEFLGGPAANSALSAQLREKKGLVYSVEAHFYSFPDVALWEIYFACDAHDVDRCIKLVERELERLGDAPLSEAKWAAYRKQLKGQLAIAYEAREARTISAGKRFATYGQLTSLDEFCERLDALSPEQIQEIAEQELVPERFTTLILK